MSIYTYTRADERARVHAAVPASLNFQARLQSSSGGIVPDGNYSVAFNMYNVSSGGTSQWNETQNVTVKNGYFSVYLGDVNSLTGLDWSLQYWLTLNVAGDGEMSPRIRMTSVPYAFRSGQADSLTYGSGTLSASNLAQLSPSSIQAVNTALAALRINQTGAGGLLQLQGDGGDVLTLDKLGNLVIDGTTQINSGSALEQLTVGGAINIGTTTNSNAGTIRWTGTDFEGFDGTSWLSFTDDYTGTPTININKSANEQLTADNTLQPDNELTFPIEANETWTYRFLVQASSPTAADIRFSVTAPGGATCVSSVSNPEDGAAISNLGCGVASGTINTTNAPDVYEVNGTIVNSGTPGTVTLNWAQAAPSGTTTVFAGSYVMAMRVQGTVSGLEFMTGGNSFGALAELGTNDNFGLDIQTNGTTRISIADSGEVTLNTLTDATAGLVISGGDLDLSGTESILNIGSNISGSNGLTLSSGSSGDLVLDSASGLLVLNDAILLRQATGTTTIQLDDTSDTTFSIVNPDGTAVANLSVEGAISATSFSGDGSGLTALNAGNISSGTLDDARLSTDVIQLDLNQTFTGRPTFSDGLILGGSSSTSAGALRWNGSEFQGYDGIQWVSLAGGGGGGPTGPGNVSVIKPADEAINTFTTPQDDDDLEFAIGANEDWTFRFVVHATSPAAADIKFVVTAPSGATCDVSVIQHETAASEADLGCGVESGLVTTNNNADTYEIVGTVRNGANPGNVTLQWAQFVSNPGDTTVLEGSFLTASVEGGSLQFFQNGNAFGQTALLGTTDNFGLNFITNNVTALAIDSSGNTSFTGLAQLSGGANIGNASGDAFVIHSSAVSLPNGLNFDSDTLVIDAANNTIGINNAAPDNKLSINTPNTSDSSAQALIYTGGINNKGLVLQRNSGQVANLFEAQNENGQTLTFINNNGQLGLGRGSGLDGSLIFHNSSNNNTASIVASAFSGSRTIGLPDEDGTICLSDSPNCGFVVLGTSTSQTDGSNDNTIHINKTTASGNLLTLERNGNGVFTIFNNGALQLNSDSSTALEIRNAAGTTSFFTVNTTGNIVQIGNSTTDVTGILFVLDSKSGGDPGGVAGASYYNSDDNKARCYEDGVWTDCINKRILGETTLSVAAGTITVNLSQSVESLQCRLEIKGRSAAGFIHMRLNGDNGAAAYSWNAYGIVAAAVTDWQDNSDDSMQITGTATSNSPLTADIRITSFNDTRKAVDWTATNAEAIGVNLDRYSGGGAWEDTTNSVSSVSFVTSAGNFLSGSHAYCEGRNVR